MTLISSNYPIAIEYNKVKTTIQGIHLLQGNNIYIQGHNIDNSLGEFKQPEVLPLIIENHQRSFEPCNNVLFSSQYKRHKLFIYTQAQERSSACHGDGGIAVPCAHRMCVCVCMSGECFS